MPSTPKSQRINDDLYRQMDSSMADNDRDLSNITRDLPTPIIKMPRTPKSRRINDDLCRQSNSCMPYYDDLLIPRNLSMPTIEMPRTPKPQRINDNLYRQTNSCMANDDLLIPRNLPMPTIEMPRTPKFQRINDDLCRQSNSCMANNDLLISRNLIMSTIESPTLSCPEKYFRNLPRLYGQGNYGHTSSYPNNYPGPSVAPIKNFEITLDVHEYKQEELKVSCIDDVIVIEGNHGERMDDVSLVSRHFIRKYLVPKDVDKESINCTLSSNGILSVIGSKIRKGREIPIMIVYKSSTAKPGNAEVPEKFFFQELKNQQQQIIDTEVLIKKKTVEKPVSPANETPEAKEQENAPDN